MAFGERDYETAAATLHDLRHLAQRCGGSRAQCDLLHLTLVESALRCGNTPMARSLVAERIASRPHSVSNWHLMARVAGAASPSHPAWRRLKASPDDGATSSARARIDAGHAAVAANECGVAS
jgi:hypothetical protein